MMNSVLFYLFKKTISGQVQWAMLIIPAYGRLRQEDHSKIVSKQNKKKKKRNGRGRQESESHEINK
jgi:hypothetical protein